MREEKDRLDTTMYIILSELMLTTTTLSVDRAEPNKLDRRVQIDLNILGLSYMTTCYSFPSSASWLMSYRATPCVSMTGQSALLVAFVTLIQPCLRNDTKSAAIC
jgi:hypothetical protein